MSEIPSKVPPPSPPYPPLAHYDDDFDVDVDDVDDLDVDVDDDVEEYVANREILDKFVQ